MTDSKEETLRPFGVPNKRLEWIDVAKGLGLALTILGHLLYSGTWSTLNKFIYAFHMPMYFILSGFVVRTSDEATRHLLRRRAYQLLLPSLIFILLSLPLYFHFSGNASVVTHLRTISFFNGKVAFNEPIWFLLVLFEVILFFNLFSVDSLSTIFKAMITALSFIVGYIVYKFSIFMPFGLDKMIVCFGFYVLGNLLKDIPRSKKWTIIVMLLCLFAFPPLAYFNSKVSLYGFALGKYWLFIGSSITGSILWFGFCYLLRNIKLFQFWGQNTIFVVCTQYFWIVWVREAASLLKISHTIYFDLIAVAITFLMLLLYVPLCKLVNRYCPFWWEGKTLKKSNFYFSLLYLLICLTI